MQSFTDDEDEEQTWWSFYPFCGITITNARHDLRTPIFGDVTFIAKNHVPQVVALLRLPPDEGYDAQQIKGLIHDIEEIAKKDVATTFLAVRRRGVAYEDDDGQDPPIVHTSRERAYEVAALLAVATLATSRTLGACGLGEQIHRRPEDLAMLDVDEGGLWVRTSGRRVLSPFSAETDESMTRATLKRLLFRRPFTPLTEIMLTKRSTLPPSLRQSLKQATVRLADAIHSPTDTARLLGAVITLELLFSAADREKYDVHAQRLAAFLGSETASHFGIEAIFKARHRYVHEGLEVRDEAIPYQAITLALLCLVRYANSVNGFKDKRDFVEYLDFIYRAERRAASWNESRRKALGLLLQHNRNVFHLPFGPLSKPPPQ